MFVSSSNARVKLLQLILKQSVKLTAYLNNSIYATHTGINKFKTLADS